MSTFPYPNPLPPLSPAWMTSGIMALPLTPSDLEKIRAIVQEEVHKALYPEEQGESIDVALEHNGKRYEGTLYLVEEQATEEEE